MNPMSIEAYFHSQTAAQSIVTKLKALRVLDVQIDQVELPGNVSGEETTILVEANEQVGGVGPNQPLSSYFDNSESSVANGSDTLLKAIIDESSYEQALRVIREGGGVI
jgi:hypothetical protein